MIPTPPDRSVSRLSIITILASIVGCILSALLGPEIGVLGAIMCGSAVPIVALTCIGILFNRRWLIPIRSIRESAEHLAANQWSRRTIPSGTPDLRTTALALNSIGETVGELLGESQGRFGDLQTIADALADPILLTDREERVAVLNAAAARLFKVSTAQAVGKRASSVVGDEPILRLLDPHLTAKNQADPQAVRHHEIRVLRGAQRSTYQAVVRPTRSGGILLVLRDVSSLAGAAQMKTDFVANASHELRTPITAIKIAFETLSDVYREDAEQTAKCVAIIDGHLRRLEEMLGDLLDLSRVEAPGVEPNLVVIHLEQLFAGLRAAMEPMARQKLVELAFGESSQPVPDLFVSDVRLLNLTLKNLVENSIKFTSAGGKVSIDIVRDENSATGVALIVADTGIGIPPEHLERVFERFYQVDAARSGSAGRGTGLGLAIVKHAVHALGGSVDLKSEVGVGTTITCKLPARESGQIPEP